MSSTELKERLATLRAERGYSLRELRDRIERETGDRMSFSYLSSLERVGGSPSLETLAHIAAGYGLSVQALLGPVDLTSELSSDRYPQSLLDFVKVEQLGPEWLDTLASIQLRGERPNTFDEWSAIHRVLQLVANRKGEEIS